LQSAGLRHLTKTLAGIGASPEGRREMEAEEAIRRLVEGDFNPIVQKIRRKLKKKDKALAKSKKVIAETKKAITEKDNVIAESKKALAEKDKEIADLKSQFALVKAKQK
jgi:hypothetical protein